MRLKFERRRLWLGSLVAAATACAAPHGGADGGPRGASPPTVLSTAHQARLSAILAPYRPQELSPDQVRSIRQALQEAGLVRSPALDAAMTRAGFSPKRLEALDPSPPAAASAAPPTSRKVPRPQ